MTAIASSIRPSRATRPAANPAPRTLEDWWQWLNQAVPLPRATSHGRVLLISYQFPPTGGSGVQRPAKLAKYLPGCGWSVEVLTAAHDRFPWTDASLLADLPGDLAIRRVAGYEPACVARWIGSQCERVAGPAWGVRVSDALHWRLSSLADRLGLERGESFWIGAAARAAISAHREKPYDAVISTGPPHFAHYVALRMTQATGVPWLADLRDPLVSDFDRSNPSSKRNERMRRLESAIMQQAAMVVTTCPSFALDLQERYPDRTARVRAVTNGFDRDDILRSVQLSDLDAESADECVFVAAGALYGRRELGRIIHPLQRLLQLHPAWTGRVRLIIAGTIDAEQRSYWQQHAPEWVSFLGYVDHTEAIRLTARASCAIIIVPACEHGRMSIPGKTFELLALPTHVLGLVPPGSDTDHLLRRAGGCTLAPFEREHAVAAAMRTIIETRLTGQPGLDRHWPRVDAFDRRLIARRFADCLEAICRRSATASRRCPENYSAAGGAR